MAYPSIRAVGTRDGGTGAVTIVPPASHVAGDLEFLFVESANQTVTLSTAAGFTNLVDNAVIIAPGTGTAGGTAATELTVFWRRWNGTDGSPTIADSGDHQIGIIISIQNAGPNAPHEVTTSTQDTATTSASSASWGITGIDSLVIFASAGSGPDSLAGGDTSNLANSKSVSLTTNADISHNAGNGGAIQIFSGTVAAGSDAGTTTWTTATSAVKAHVVMAITGFQHKHGQSLALIRVRDLEVFAQARAFSIYKVSAVAQSIAFIKALPKFGQANAYIKLIGGFYTINIYPNSSIAYVGGGWINPEYAFNENDSLYANASATPTQEVGTTFAFPSVYLPNLAATAKGVIRHQVAGAGTGGIATWIEVNGIAVVSSNVYGLDNIWTISPYEFPASISDFAAGNITYRVTLNTFNGDSTGLLDYVKLVASYSLGQQYSNAQARIKLIDINKNANALSSIKATNSSLANALGYIVAKVNNFAQSLGSIKSTDINRSANARAIIGISTNLYTAVDEVTLNNDDYITTAGNNTGATIIFDLDPTLVPKNPDYQKLNVRFRTSGSGLSTSLELYQKNPDSPADYNTIIPLKTLYNGSIDTRTDSDPIESWGLTGSTGISVSTSVAYGNGFWLAGGTLGGLRITSDPENTSWVGASLGVSQGILSIAYGNGYWLVGTSTGSLRYATDPRNTFQSVGTYPGGSASRITYANGWWVIATTGGAIYAATDPLGTWESPVDDGFSTAIQSVAYGNDYWVAVGNSGTISHSQTGPSLPSSDPRGSWINPTSHEFGTNTIEDVAYGNGYWVAVGANGIINYATDPDGPWVKPANANFGTTTINSVYYANNYWVAVGNDGSINYTSDPTGMWLSSTYSKTFPSVIKQVTFGGNHWLAIADNSRAYYTGQFIKYTYDVGTLTPDNPFYAYKNLVLVVYGEGLGLTSSDKIQISQIRLDTASGYDAVYAQSQAKIIYKIEANAQAQSNIISTNFSLAQVQAYILPVVFGQAIGYILATIAEFGNAQTTVRGNAFSQASSSILATSSEVGNANAYIFTTNFSSGQAVAGILGASVVYAQALSLILVKEFAQASANSSILANYQVSANSLADILQVYLVTAQAQAAIRGNAFGQSQTSIILSNLDEYGQATAYIKLVDIQNFAQSEAYILLSDQIALANAEASILLIKYDFAQALAYISIKENALANSSAYISIQVNQIANAEAYIKLLDQNVFANTNAYIYRVEFTSGQSASTILATSIVTGQSEVWILATDFAYAQSQTYIKLSDVSVFAQSESWILAIYTDFAQSEAYIKLVDISNFANTQASIKAVYDYSGNAQTTLRGNAFSQASSAILNSYTQFASTDAYIYRVESQEGQAAASIIGGKVNFGQSLALIIVGGFSSANTLASILANYQVNANALSEILAVYNFSGQAQATIRGNAFAQSTTIVKVTTAVYANSSTAIKNIYIANANSSVSILASVKALAQSQSTIKAVYVNCAQVKSSIKTTNNTQAAQVQAHIRITNIQGFANAQARILGRVFSQAQGLIVVTDIEKVANSLALIRRTEITFGNAQSLTRTTVIYNGQANALIVVPAIEAIGQAFARIKASYIVSAQASVWSKRTETASASVKAYILNWQGYGQSKAFIKIKHYLEIVNIRDRNAFNVNLTDRGPSTTNISDEPVFTTRLSDRAAFNIRLTDIEALNVNLTDDA